MIVYQNQYFKILISLFRFECYLAENPEDWFSGEEALMSKHQ